MMKNLLMMTILTSFLGLQSCKLLDKTYDGRWMRHDFEINVNIVCDCTQTEKEEKFRYIYYSIETWLIKKDLGSFLQLNPDHTFSASIFGEETQGTYTSILRGICLEHEDGTKEKVKIQENDVFVIFEKELPQNITNEATESLNQTSLELPAFDITSLKIILQIPPLR